MKAVPISILLVFLLSLVSTPSHSAHLPPAPKRQRTTVSIAGDEFRLNGQPTYPGRTWRGHKIQGLLINSRMVQGIFDDRNPATVTRWAYPDTGRWDPNRNTREFVAAMPSWREHGMLAFTVNLQGGSPEGYSREQPWHNSAFESDGSIRSDYLKRLKLILDRAEELGMVVIVGYFYFGQDQRLKDEAAILRGTDNATRWLLRRGYRNVLVEVNNECDVQAYDHDILKPDRVHELILRVKNHSRGERHLLVGTSYGGGSVPRENVVRASDFLLVHGNGVSNPDRIADMVNQTRAVAGYTPKPILFNEDDHFEFDQARNNFIVAVSQYASWGYFDPGQSNYRDGYQSPPVNWSVNTDRKRSFFELIREMTGGGLTPDVRVQKPDFSPKQPTKFAFTRLNYKGWPDSLVLSNGKVEAVVVAAIGRVMQFRFAGEEDGPFWENQTLKGKAPDPTATNWVNFGGDKTWPAPQADWPKLTPRAWPPPPAFDSMPVQSTLRAGTLVLTSPTDPYYGIRTERRIELDPKEPVMTITTSYEKVAGPPVSVGVWVITQLKDPLAVYAPVGKNSIYPDGYNKQSPELPANLRVHQGLLSLTRHRKTNHKIGCDASTLLWVGERSALRIDSPRVPHVEYPDQGSSAEIYTNPDPNAYVELEMLGPLQSMKIGDKIQRTNIYTLQRRRQPTAQAEARAWLGGLTTPTP